MTKKLLLIVSIILVLLFWTQGGFDSVNLTTDIGRDLSQMSNLWIGKHVIWLGPRLSMGFPASPIYYYIFYPALWIARGNSNASIVFNIIISTFALLLFGWLSLKKYGTKAVVGVLLIGLTPWWINIAMVPGNGFTYIFWLMISLTLLWFEFPIFLSALFLGLSISFHPAAVVALSIVIFEWARRGKHTKTMLLSILALVLPWTPIIIYEFITKGFLTRSFLANPSAGFFKIHPGITNIQTVLNSLGLNLFFVGAISLVVYIISSRRLRAWLIITTVTITILNIFQELPSHYLLGIAATLSFIFVVSVNESLNKSNVAKIVLVLLLVNNLIVFTPRLPATRTISKIDSVVNAYINSGNLERDKKIAVVAVLGPGAESPQGDDYRYFFRVKGYNALEVIDYDKADVLIEFIEDPTFSWQDWSTWETDRFGKRESPRETDIQGIKVITYTKTAVY